MNNKILEAYQDLELEYRAMTIKRDTMRTLIVEEMQKAKIDKAETDFGKFTVGARSTWEYTDKVKKLQEKVKIAQVKEQQKGTAKMNVTHYLVYGEVKPE